MFDMMRLIETIRTLIDDGNLSFIIGSGFSNNISDSYPLWDGLLKDMLNEMYFDNMYKGTAKQRRELKHIICEKGYLAIASEYVRRHGYHEAIDLYIERHIPYLQRKNNEDFELYLDGKVIDTHPDLRCHRKLIDLGVQHIFTFNYDNTLEVVGNADVKQESFQKEQNAIQEKKCLENAKSQYLKEVDEIFNQPSTSTVSGESSPQIETYNVSRINTCIDKWNGELHLKLKKLERASNWTSIHDENIEQFNNQINAENLCIAEEQTKTLGCYQTIENGYQISLTEGQRNIYKLHGNLRIPKRKDMDNYGFDNDRHRQYIITKEDYESYSTRHDAFVNLMRISLLKGKFCVIGFSCDDPNFLAWISWVKDVLDHSPNSSHDNSIFFINVDKESLDEEKSLLLKNHYITPVDLFQVFPKAKDRKSRILCFLEAIKLEKTQLNEYKTAWNHINKIHSQFAISRFGKQPPEIKPSQMHDLEHAIEYIFQNQSYFRLSGLKIPMVNYIESVIPDLSKYLENKLDRRLVGRLAYSAIQSEYMPLFSVGKVKELKNLWSEDVVLKEKGRLLEYRSRTLLHLPIPKYLQGNGEDLFYESVLNHLTQLHFDKVYELLGKWKPQLAFNKMRKLLLLSIYEEELNKEEINSLLYRNVFQSVQDYKIALEQLPILRHRLYENEHGGQSFDYDLHDIQSKLDHRNPNLCSLRECLEKLFHSIDSSSAIKQSSPFGNQGKVFHIGSENPSFYNSIKVIQIFMEFGYSTQSNRVSYVKNEDWIKVCSQLYELYPYPCLYYTLLYGDSKNLVRQLAQKYIYSNTLYPQLRNLLLSMFAALTEQHTPRKVKTAIHIAAPIFMSAVPVSIWLPDFRKIFISSTSSEEYWNRFEGNPINDFFCYGITHSGDNQFKKEVISIILSRKAKLGDITIRLADAASGHAPLDEKDISAIKEIMNVTTDSAAIVCLLNIVEDYNAVSFSEKLLSLSQHKYTEYLNLLVGACWYANKVQNSSLKSYLQDIFVHYDRLWDSGLNKKDGTIGFGYPHLPICDIQKYLDLSDDHVQLLYQQMREALTDMEKYAQKETDIIFRRFFDDWTVLLYEMEHFLQINKAILVRNEDYTAIKKRVIQLLSKERGGTTIKELILDDENTGKGITALVEEVVPEKIKSYEEEYSLLINKMIGKQSEYLNSCFKHVGWAVSTYPKRFSPKLFKPLLKNLLQVYHPYFTSKNQLEWDLKYAEKDVVERELLKLFKVYMSWGGNDRFWDRYKPRYFHD